MSRIALISRETAVHAVAVILGVGIPTAYLGTRSGGVAPATMLAVGILSYGLVFGGSHLYFALRGEDGMVPVRSRWRFVGTVALVLALWAVAFLATESRIGSVSVPTVAGGASVVVMVAYFLREAVDGYRQSQPES